MKESAFRHLQCRVLRLEQLQFLSDVRQMFRHGLGVGSDILQIQQCGLPLDQRYHDVDGSLDGPSGILQSEHHPAEAEKAEVRCEVRLISVRLDNSVCRYPPLQCSVVNKAASPSKSMRVSMRDTGYETLTVNVTSLL